VTHVAAVLFHHLARHEKLVHAMVTGKRPWPGDVKPPQLRFAPNWVAAVWLLLSLGAVFAVLASLAR
jgi:hypothetical protein